MNDEKFEDGFEHNNYDYTLLDTHYESRENKIIEWNKHSSNAEYFNNDLKGIAELLNIKQMKLESVEKYDVRIGELFDKIESLEKENEQLRQELQGMNELLKSYRKTIKHDAELLADATRNGYLPPLDDFVKR